MITILVPNYNNSQYLHDFFDSLLMQTDNDFVVLFSDDCSTDSSIEVVNTYKDRLSIDIISTPTNLHLVGNLNFAIPHIKTKYFLKVDPDDILMPNAIEEGLAHIKNNDLDICGCQFETFGSFISKEKNPIDGVEIKLLTSLFPCIAQFIYKTEIFDNIKYREIKGAEDYDFWVQVLSAGLNIGAIDKVLFKYRIHDQNATRMLSDLIESTVVSVREDAIKLNFDYSDCEVKLLASIPSNGAKSEIELEIYMDFVDSILQRNPNPSSIFLRAVSKWVLRVYLLSAKNISIMSMFKLFGHNSILTSLSYKEITGLFFVLLFKFEKSSRVFIILKRLYKRL